MPENCGRAVNNRFDEKDGVKLIDVVLVGDCPVEPAEAGGNAPGQLRAATVETIRQQRAEPSHANGNTHEQMLECAVTSFAGGFLHNFPGWSLKRGSQKMFETISVADESPNHGQYGKDHQRTQHHPRALMRLAVPMTLSMIVTSMTVLVVTVRFLHRGAPVLAAECHVHQPEHRSEEHTSELQSLRHLVCRLL